MMAHRNSLRAHSTPSRRHESVHLEIEVEAAQYEKLHECRARFNQLIDRVGPEVLKLNRQLVPSLVIN